MTRFCPTWGYKDFKYTDEELKTIYEITTVVPQNSILNLFKLSELHIIKEGIAAYRERLAEQHRT